MTNVSVHPAWLPAGAWRPIGSRRVRVDVSGTVRDEIEAACAAHGGELTDAGADLTLRLSETGHDGYAITRAEHGTTVTAATHAGLLHGLFAVVRMGESAFTPGPRVDSAPAFPRRMLDHWDNIDVHPVMGQVERGYAGGSLFWSAGTLRAADLPRIGDYARLLAGVGINAVALNNVNVHATEARLLTDRLPEMVLLAQVFRRYGIRVHLAVTFAAPMLLGGLDTADPLDPAVRAWWAMTLAGVCELIPDFGGVLVKADSEGRPGPFAYGRTHADGANMLAEALAPHGGTVHWRAFVYDHRQDWRDRSTDRARAAHDHFTPLDGAFADNVIVQVKHGPMDFQPREPVSPVLAAMPRTRLALELQATQEYTGQQRHVCYLAPMWSEILAFRPRGDDGPPIAGTVAEMVAVANTGDDPFWTGHPLAQANLYAFGRLAWDPTLAPGEILDEWITLTFEPDDGTREALHAIMDGSWRTYESYTAPLGVGFMVRPGHHYGPDVDGYEYTPWGTYHFADRDGVGVDRTVASGTGFAGLYPYPWDRVFESLTDCPDELLLFMHHVPYTHVLRSGRTVIQHIYDTHFDGVAAVEAMRERWRRLRIAPDVHARVAALLDEQVRSAIEWRDQINTYFFRKSGIGDAHGRMIY
ncbi:alpha-glucuronidase [Catenuloplanes nepalensis]|uniref:Alpha-glucuronidase n=1 Tax=Catenuloplanes nepalensis TaxID=587533 RepID=A0ABT9MU34_9ACTN|nr:alpha-glucuronidase [Catenuloplanes nepalensis]MDP9794937.1 alpha-glucuronidase [Catenuloplanes nepalensis]